MKKIKLKYKILLIGQFIVIYAGVLILINWILWNEELTEKLITMILIQSIICGVLFGFAFPFILEKLAPQLIKSVKTPELQGTESIIMDDGANLFRNKWIAVGGKLFLTNKRLIFNSHKYNFQKGETYIPLENIEKIIPRKTGRIVDNGLRIQTFDNKSFDFVVNEREAWMENFFEQKNIS